MKKEEIQLNSLFNKNINTILSLPIIKNTNERIIDIGKKFSAIRVQEETNKKIVNLGFPIIGEKFLDELEKYQDKKPIFGYVEIPEIMIQRIETFLNNIDLFDSAIVYRGTNYNQKFYILKEEYEIENGKILSSPKKEKDPLLIGFSGEKYYYIAHWGCDIPIKFIKKLEKLQ